MTFAGTPRPRRRWWHASTRLDDCVRITYRVETSRLRRHVPAAFEPAVFTFDDGSEGSLVSAVSFEDRDFAFRLAPWLKVSGGQLDYVAYGSLRGEAGIWFFGSSLDSRFVLAPRLAWCMPVHRDRVRIDTLDEVDGRRVIVSATGSWGAATVDVESAGKPLARLDGFIDAEHTAAILTHPMVGWFTRRPRGRRVSPSSATVPGGHPADIARYSVWHEALEAEQCLVRNARFTVFEDLGLLTSDTEPHSALLQRAIVFDVHMPPRRDRRALT